jgi:PAS domain S-box-containing protein
VLPEEVWRAATRAYRSLIEELPVVTRLLLLDPISTVFVSPQVEGLTGYPLDRWIDEPELWLSAIHDDDRERMSAVTADHAANGTPISEEYRMSAPDDRIVWIREESRVIPDASGRPVASQGILLDVTERKRVEQDLETNVRFRQALASRLVNAEEDERARVAAEIFDGPIQALSELKPRLQVFIQGLADAKESAELTDIAATMDRAIDRLGLVVSELHPPLRDASGLISLVRFMLRELAEFAGVASHLDERIRDELSPETCRIVYRIFNECLINIRKHARARNVVVAMESTTAGILVAVEDNGTGFDVARVDEDPANHIGVQLMRERAEAAGGWYRQESTPGLGTTTRFWIPSSPVYQGG